MQQNTLLSFALLLSIVALGLFFYSSEQPAPTPANPSGFPLPTFHLINLMQPEKSFTQQDLQGHIALLTIWNSGCYACRVEQPILMKITQEYKIPIFSLNYLDGTDAAKQWLQRWGNPFVATGMDTTGFVAMQMGVYGTPETFLIDESGTIRYRHVGVLDQTTWDNVLLPLVRQYELQ